MSWYDNVVRVESAKHNKIQQDSTDNVNFVASKWTRVKNELQRPTAIFDMEDIPRFRLDQTECALRQRRKLRPDHGKKIVVQAKESNLLKQRTKDKAEELKAIRLQEQDYEVLEPPRRATLPEEDQEEDRNRKVLRSLDLGDEVQEVVLLSGRASLELTC